MNQDNNEDTPFWSAYRRGQQSWSEDATLGRWYSGYEQGCSDFRFRSKRVQDERIGSLETDWQRGYQQAILDCDEMNLTMPDNEDC